MARDVIATDNFNRASLGSNWAQLYPFNGSIVINTSIRADSDVAGQGQNAASARWVGAGTFTGDQYAVAKIAAAPDDISTAYWTGVIVRASADQGSARDFYYAIFESSGAGPNYTTRVGKVVNGTHTSLATSAQPWALNDTIELEVEGSALRVFRNGTQITALNVTDTALTTGAPGVLINQSRFLDDWEGGNITAAGGGPATPAFRMSLLGVGR